MNKRSFFLPEFHLSNVNQCANIEELNRAFDRARETLKTVVEMIDMIEQQKKVVAGLSFVYRIEWFKHPMWRREDRYYYYVSVRAFPSDSSLRSFRMPGTYTQCYTWFEGVQRARELVVSFGEKGIEVEFDEGGVE